MVHRKTVKSWHSKIDSFVKGALVWEEISAKVIKDSKLWFTKLNEKNVNWSVLTIFSIVEFYKTEDNLYSSVEFVFFSKY